jgi:hypothetical protein
MTLQELYDRVDEEYNKHYDLYNNGYGEFTPHHYNEGAMDAYANMLLLLLQCEGVIAE